MYLGTAEECTLLAAEEGGLRGGGESVHGGIQGGEEGGKVLNHPLGLTGEVCSGWHYAAARVCLAA
jgi:hypothetical protein